MVWRSLIISNSSNPQRIVSNFECPLKLCLFTTAPTRPWPKTLRQKQNTRHMRSRGYCWEPRQWCQRASKGHNPGTGTPGPQDEPQNPAEDRKQSWTAPGGGGEAKPTRWRLQSGRSVWQMPFKRVIKDGFMWSVCSKAVNYLRPVTVTGFQREYLGWGATLQHAAALNRQFLSGEATRLFLNYFFFFCCCYFKNQLIYKKKY